MALDKHNLDGGGFRLKYEKRNEKKREENEILTALFTIKLRIFVSNSRKRKVPTNI